MSGQQSMDFDQAAVNAPRRPADTRVAPAWYHFNWDATKASAEDAYHRVPGRDYELRRGEMAAAAAQLSRLTQSNPDKYYMLIPGEPMDGHMPDVDADSFWRDLSAYRRSHDATALHDLGKDQADFESRFRQRANAGLQSRSQRMAQNGALGNLAGGIAGSLTDPINIITMPFGPEKAAVGGLRAFAGYVIKSGLANAAVEVAETPLNALEMHAQGREFSASEAAQNIGYAFGGGVALPLLGKTASASARAAYNRLPLDYRLARALRQAVPDHSLTPQQAAALHVVERAGEIDATNPFQHSYGALDEHAARLDAAMRAVAGTGEQFAPNAKNSAAPAPAIARQGAEVATQPHFEAAWHAIIGNEGGTNRDGTFRTSPAGAIGPAQVMPGTAREAARLAGVPFDDARYRSDPVYNDKLGRAYYGEMLRQFDGDAAKAAAAYNAGPGSARKGTGVRGAMARAQAAGRAGDWEAFLPHETQGYVANFRRRTGMADGETIDAGTGGIAEAMQVRPDALDAVRPLVTEPLDVRADAMHDGLLTASRSLMADRSISLNDHAGLAEQLGVGEHQIRAALDDLVARGELRVTAKGTYRRLPVAGVSAPEDMLQFIARRGGIAYDGLDAAGRAGGTLGHDLRNSGNLAAFVPGAGPLLRPAGRGLDAMGEMLHDAGYFGPPETTPRPTDGELITLLDDVIRRKDKRFSFFDQAPAEKGSFTAPAEEMLPDHSSADHYEYWDSVGDYVGAKIYLKSEMAAVERLMAEGTDRLPPLRRAPGSPRPSPKEVAPYVVEMINREIDDVLEAAHAEIEDPIYDQFASSIASADNGFGREAGAAATGGAGQAVDPGNPRAREAGTGDEFGSGPEGLDTLTAMKTGEQVLAGFDDPAGARAIAQAAGLAHDLRVALDAGELEGLTFSASAEGVMESAALAMARLDEEDAALAAVRGCL